MYVLLRNCDGEWCEWGRYENTLSGINALAMAAAEFGRLGQEVKVVESE